MNLRKKAPADGVAEEAGGSNRKGLIVGGCVAAGLALVAGMGYVLMSGGDDAADTGVVASANHGPAAQPTADPTSAATAAPAIKKFNGKNARDPFKALVVEPVKSTSTSTSGPAAGTGSTASGTASTVPTTGSTPTVTSIKPSSTTITMVAVNGSNTEADLKVDKKPFNDVKPMTEFGESFKLLNLHDGKCGAVQYGDITFDLCEGKTLNIG